MATETLNQKLRRFVGDGLFGANLVEEQFEKAVRDSRVQAQDPKTFFFDPMTQFFGQPWLPKRGGVLTFNDLRAMSGNPIVGAILQTRLNQMSLFTVPQRDPFTPGFKIVSDDPEAMNDTRRIQQLTDFMFHAGVRGFGEVSLEMFVRKFMRDSLILDQACAEVVPRLNTRPAYFIPVDGATMRLLKDKPLEQTPSKRPRYMQVINDQPQATFNEDEMIFAIRNPSTDIRKNGYGMSELEILVRTITAILNTERFNSSLVAQGGTNKGIFVIEGDAPNEQVQSFKRDFREAVRNAAQYWRPPVLQVADKTKVEWVTIDRSNRDIEYAQLFDFLVKQTSAVYNIHPEELGWSVKATGARATFSSSDLSKLNHSLEKGLRPLLKFLATILTECIIQRFDPRFRIEFVGLNADRERDIKNKVNEVSHWKTVNEMRQEMGLPTRPGWDIVLNQNLIFWLARQTQESAETEIDIGIAGNLGLDRARNQNKEETKEDKQDELEEIEIDMEE